MSTTTWQAQCRPEDVFAVLSDGWLYPTWVVGAARARKVEGGWPTPGAEIHHSVGVWPMMINDTTSVIRCDPPHRLELRGRAWPAGEVDIDITVEPSDGGCAITITEDAVAGPAAKIPPAVRGPMFHARNRETLRRLALLAEGHARS
jgi:uncharacterized protein YndB with AHSA1/START domain